MRTKHEYTQVFVKHSPSKDLSIDQAPSIFWMNPREDGGMRLTDIGFNFLTKTLNLESFSIDVRDVKFNGKFLIGLDRFVKSPYYLEIGRWSRITLFDGKTYFALTMYGNDFEKFIKAHKI